MAVLRQARTAIERKIYIIKVPYMKPQMESVT